MDLGNIDPELLKELRTLIAGVKWGGGAIIAAIALRIAGVDLGDLVRAVTGRGGRG